MKKAFDQTVRDLKRGVNKKVLKVPSIEQKVLDATSNEPWGPHGSLLADIAQASRNYHEYQMIMSVVWKRINDTGKNWRHVYKGLTVLEYLVAHGSERVVDDIREHAYQISTLSDFQYIDSSGRDQGSNVRKKSQSLVVLVNDKERIQEVRQKAASNRDKFRNTSAGGMYRPGSQSGSGGYGDRFDEDRYGGRDDERSGYGREREWGYRDEDKNGRYGDSNSRDGDRYGRDYDDRSRDGNKDDDYRGRSRSTDDYNYGSRSRSSDRYRDHTNDDDGQYSSRPLERRFSEQNLSAPPSYEEAVGGSRSPTHSERDVETSSASAPKSSSPHASASPSPVTVPAPAPATAPPPAPAAATASPPSPAAAPAPPPENTVAESFDEFDPRASFTAAPPVPSNGPASTTSGGEMDLLGSLCDPFSNALALVPAASSASEVNPSGTTGTETTFGEASSVSTGSNQMFEDPFGDGPFRAMTSNNVQTHLQNTTPAFHPNPNQNPELPQSAPQGAEISNATYSQFDPTNMQYAQQELSTSNQEIDILADILPPSGPSPPGDHAIPSVQPATQTGFESYGGPTTQQTGYMAPPGQAGALTVFAAQPGQQSPQTSFPIQGQTASSVGFSGQANNSPSYGGYPTQPGQASQTGFGPTGGQPTSGFQPAAGYFPQSGYQIPAGSVQSNANAGGYNTGLGSTGPFGNQMGQTSAGQPYLSQPTGATHMPSQMHLQSSQNQTSNALVLTQTTPASTALVANTQPAKDKFETKSTVWADTLSRGLVNLNISGTKTNPLADIGVDFDAINRKEKRMEKPSTAPVISTINMGKAMGSGTGVGRAGAGALRAPPNPMVGSGMGMGMGIGMGSMGMAGGGPAGGPGMGAYGGNQPYGGMGMNRPMNNMGMGMNMGQGFQMQQPSGFPPGPGAPMQGGYNPRMGMGPYGQQPYGGGYQ
ncbi:clathrin interactor EPSIN 2-like isoform X1 [Solanum pennellii]|uniref:Clathrin interactor EPSIN 2-like isoform X1 n=2 Tax=Solanum pennellii TaxID=28526 RepID=A0ABM1FSL8_SOLPN|nr:clathrin interactor EPSIN 2-like isoform X1 [Solanum pennellii]